MQKTEFIVTDLAGPFVAGRPSPGVGQPVMLTEEQATYPLLNGEIERPVKGKPAKPAPAPDA